MEINKKIFIFNVGDKLTDKKLLNKGLRCLNNIHAVVEMCIVDADTNKYHYVIRETNRSNLRIMLIEDIYSQYVAQ